MRRHVMTNEKLRFPGLNKCLAMMRSRNPQLAEDGFAWLQRHASVFVDRFLEEFDGESDFGVRCWLLELIGDACSEKALPTLIEQLKNTDERLQIRAVRGLKQLNSKPARAALWEFGVQLPDV